MTQSKSVCIALPRSELQIDLIGLTNRNTHLRGSGLLKSSIAKTREPISLPPPYQLVKGCSVPPKDLTNEALA